MDHPQRLHALDNLRAVMMWLGIVLHVSANHLVGESPLPWRDSQTTLVANLLCAYIHSFRMPVFFILAGFFVALLVGRRDFGGMLKHRMRRIGLPFVIFWPPIFIAVIAMAMLYIHMMARGSLGMDPSIMPIDPDKPQINTLHMWFIYYLLWFCVLTALVGVLTRKLPARIQDGLSRTWKAMASNWWGFIVLALPLVIVGSFYKAGLIVANGSFIPRVTELIHNGMFYVFGWYLYRHQETLLKLYSKYCWRYSVAGAVLFFVFLGFIDSFAKTPDKIPHVAMWISFFYNCVSWLWSFALIGLFIRYLPHQNNFLRYVSESSYWVYLVHMVFTVGFGVLLYNAPFNAITKIGLNILATTLVCVVTYHVLVRFTPISTLLNGHRFSFKTGKKIDEQIPQFKEKVGAEDRILPSKALPSADAVTPNHVWKQIERRRILRNRLLLAALGLFVCFLGYSQIKFSQTSVPTRAAAPVRIAVPADIDRFLKDLGNAYGSTDSTDVAQFLSDDFLHQGMNKATFLHHLKANQQYLGKLNITPVSIEQQYSDVRVVAYAESSLGPVGPSLQLLPLHVGATLVKVGSAWKLSGNRHAAEAALYKRLATISADFVPADLDLYQRLLPAGYTVPAKPMVRVSVSNWLEMEPPQIPYRLAALSILARRNDQNIWYLLAMPETDWLAVEAGKAVGFPKFMTDIDVRRSLGNQWTSEIRYQDKSIVSFSFDPSPEAKTYFKENGQPNSDVWLLFGKDGAAVKASMIPLERPKKFKLDYGWMTVNGFASPWKDLIRPGSRAAGTSVDFTGGLKLNMYGMADASNIPAGVPELLRRTAVGWADQDMEQVMAQHHPAFTGHFGMDLVAMRRLFSFVRQYDWKIKDLREEGNIAHVKAVIQTGAGEFPVITRLIKEDDRWYFFGSGSKLRKTDR